MKVLRWQEASLESSKGFYRGSRLSLTVVTFHARKSMKMHENPWKSMKIDRKRWKSSDDKKPAWNRAKVSIGAAGCPLRPHKSYRHPYLEYMKIHENLGKSIEIYGKPWTSMENDESPQMTRSQPGIEQRFGGAYDHGASTVLVRRMIIPRWYCSCWECCWSPPPDKCLWACGSVGDWVRTPLQSPRLVAHDSDHQI